MAAKNEAKIKFTADTQQFTQGIQTARTNMASLRAAMALNNAEFKNTGNSAEFLTNKQNLLNGLIKQSQSVQADLNSKLEAAKKYYGEDSQEVAKLETAISRERTAEERLKSQLTETNEALKQQEEAEKRAQSPLEQLNSKIDEQRADLAKLQTEYANVALAEGKDSQAAKDLQGKMDALNNELGENERKLADVTGATKKAADAQENANSGWTMARGIVSNLASQGMSFLIQKLKEAAKAVIQLGTEFTASLSNVEALSGATSGQMAALEERARELGRSTIFTASNVSDAFGYMALAGWDTSQMLDGIDGVLNLAAASGMDLAQASDMVTDYLSAFGLEASDAAQMVDMLAYAQANSNTTTEQLGEAYGNAAAQMHTAGQSMETTTAILEALANQGLKGSEAGTAVAAMVRDITQKMEDGQIMIGNTAVTVQDANGNFRSMIDILGDVESATDGMGTAEKSAALMTTFTARSVKGVSEVLTEGVDNVREYEGALQSCEGTASEMTETMNDNLAGDMKELGSAAQGLGLQLFDYFEGPLRGAAQVATDVLNGITDAITPQKTELESFTEEIEAANARIKDTLSGAQNAYSSGMGNIAELEAYRDILLDLNEKSELTEFEQYQVKSAVEALSGTIPELGAAFDETTGTLSLTNQELEKLFDNAAALAIQQTMLESYTQVMDAMAQAEIEEAKAKSGLAKAEEEYNQSLAATEGTFDIYHYGTQRAVNSLSDLSNAQQDAAGMSKEAQEQLAEMEEYFQYLPDEVKGGATSLEEFITGVQNTGTATEETADIAGAASDEMVYALEEVEAEISEEEQAFIDLRDSVQQSMQDSVSFFDEFKGGAEVTAQDVINNLNSQKEGLSQWVENMEILGEQAGTGMSQQLYDKLLEMGPESANLVNMMVEELQNGSGRFEEIANTWGEVLNISNDADMLSQMSSAGRELAGEVATGLDSGVSQVESSAKSLSEKAASAADTSKITSNTSKSAESAAKTSMDNVSKTISTGMSNMNSAASTGMSQFNSAIATGMSTMQSRISLAMSVAVSSVSNGIAQMRNALGVTLRGPNVQVPHFSMSGAFNAQTGAVPVVGVRWYAKGGIFTKPTLLPAMAGVGEAGPEAVLPIDNLKDYVAEALESSGTGQVFNVTLNVDGAQDPEQWGLDFARSLKQYVRASR